MATTHTTDLVQALRKDIWAVPSDKRELQGLCLSMMMLDPTATQGIRGGQKSSRFHYVFCRVRSNLDSGRQVDQSRDQGAELLRAGDGVSLLKLPFSTRDRVVKPLVLSPS